MSQSGTQQAASLDAYKKQKTEQPSSIAQEVLQALAPTLNAMKDDIMANVNIANQKLHQTLLESILEIHKELAKYAAKINTLENQIAQVRNAQKAAPAPAGEEKPAGQKQNNNESQKNNKPQHPSDLHKRGNNKHDTKNPTQKPNQVNRKQKPAETIVPKPYPISEREIIVTFHGAMDMEENEDTADIALELVNNAITDHKDIKSGPFIRSRFSMNGNLILTAGFTFRATDYEAYLTIITDSLVSIGTASARVSEKWTKFLLHKVPTRASMMAIRHDIETYYPTIKLGQTPRWLTTPEQREGKAASTIVIAIVGSVTRKQLGVSQLQIRNRMCQLSEYYPHGPWTQCTKCQKYGHPTQLCKADEATCAVCADSHATREHPCKFETCNAGPTCTHPPIKCSNCSAPHKANDPNCPERVKKSPLLKYGINTAEDTHESNQQNDQEDTNEEGAANDAAGMQLDY